MDLRNSSSGGSGSRCGGNSVRGCELLLEGPHSVRVVTFVSVRGTLGYKALLRSEISRLEKKLSGSL